MSSSQSRHRVIVPKVTINSEQLEYGEASNSSLHYFNAIVLGYSSRYFDISMVGVGGRSKACDNCRRRRVKCDLARPQCQRCIKARLQCGGCRDITIIPYEGQSRCAPSSTEPRNDTVLSGPWRIAEAARSNANLDLSLSIPKDDLFIAYTHMHLLRGNEEIIVTPDVDRAIATQCFLALSTTYFGIKHQEKAVAQYGFRRYGNALSVLHRALGSGSASQSFDVLEAVMIMFLISNREHGWINHSRGLERLFDMRGPQSMAPLPCLMILERTRSSIIFAAILLHQPTILARPEWKREPWLMYPNRIDASKLLLDILADCPGLFILRDQLASPLDGSNKRAIVQLLLTKCHRILRDLENWEQCWAFSASEIPAPPTTPKYQDSDNVCTPIWRTVLQYQSIYHANTMSVYNGALILVLRFIQGLQVATDDTRGCEALHERTHTAAITICRSVDYHLDKMWDGQGSIALLFPLRMVHETLCKLNPAMETWLRGVLAEISAGSRGLWNDAKYLLSIEPSIDTRMEERTG